MSIIRTAVTAATVARTLVRHPVVRAGIAMAPALLTPAVQAKAKEAALTTAYGAGVLARKVMNKVRG